MNEYFEEINKSKYLTRVLTDENKEIIKKYEKLWSKMRDLISSIIKNSYDYDEKYMKTKFDLGDKLPLNKTIEIRTNSRNSNFAFFKKRKIIN